ncbi:exodeoxyribonuclease III [Roseivirga sp. BDSF3-8]|uniref:exodeoxyribonuclease III n=1 Tax=Roseivirga sp. BDSF3-8 TaxID=3241598 RepID=UPI0035322A56
MAVKIISYNVNGIRAAMNKGLIEWLKATDADILCLQELKAMQEQVDLEAFRCLGYRHIAWHSAEKKGYSGVAILSRIEPENVTIGCDMPVYDCEGRVVVADFDGFSLMSVYMPSGSSGDLRQEFKMKWLSDFENYIAELKQEKTDLVICGDFNICHQAIDIHNPVSNKNSSGFLPEERDWMSAFIDSGFIDTFRHLNPNPHHYTWWSYRAGARKKNLGWRIDYHMISESMQNRLKRSVILPDAVHSDHCPILLEIE